MKLTNDIIVKLYQILNVSLITDLISGRIYKFKRPLNSTDEDIVILSLPNRNADVQQAVIFVNIFANDLSNGTPNTAKLNEIASAVISRLEANYTGSGYFFFDIVSEGSYLKDPDFPDQSYVSIRLNTGIEKY